MTPRRKSWKTWKRGPSNQPVPESVQQELAARLLRHVTKHWKNRVRKILLRFHGRYAYVAVVEAAPGEETDPQVCRYVEEEEYPLQLCRLGYIGSRNRWEYAFFKYSTEKYAPSVCASGSFVATPEEAFNSSAVYLQG